MTVAELIAELQDMPQDLPVDLEGDCCIMALQAVTREAASEGRHGLGSHPDRVLLSVDPID